MGDNNSPILLTDVPQPIATFNKPFELSELVGNLDAIFYIKGVATYSVNCIEISEESSTKYVLGQSAETYFAELSVEGSSLYAKANGLDTYLFDLDFKHQSRKFFELTSGTYAVTLPWLGLDAESKVLVSVSGESSGKTVTIHYVDNDYRAWGQAGGSIREISWFNQLLTSANITNIVTLVDKLINLEYSPEAAGGFTVTSASTQPTTVTGDWNLFTDGSAFIPLRIVSRFPNGSPIIKGGEQNVVLCSFNRKVGMDELHNVLEAVVIVKTDATIIDNAIAKVGYGQYGRSLSLNYNQGRSTIADLIVEDNVVKIRALYANESFIYDIDFDHQFRRSVPTGVTKMNVQIPQLLGNPSTGQGIAIVTDSESPDQLYVIANRDNKRPYICQGDTVLNQLGEWGDNNNFDNVSRLLQAIVAMEFTGYDEIPINIHDSAYNESTASGYVVTPIIPQTLS